MVKKQHIARQTEYTATHMGDKTLKSQRMHNHRDGQQENDRVRECTTTETANRRMTESEDTQT